MAKIIAFANHKGGVGKTTSAVNIGAGLSRQGFKTLLVDCDGQANLSVYFGIFEPEKTIYDSIINNAELAILNVGENLDIVPADLDLVTADALLNSKPVGREVILRNHLKSVSDRYDYIILDCPPNIGPMTINALTAADEVIVPVQAEKLSEKGLDSLTDMMVEIQEALNTRLQLRGVIITFFNPQSVLHQSVRTRLESTYPDKVFKSVIRRNVGLAEAVEFNKHIFDYDKNSNGAKDYEALLNEIFEKEFSEKA